MPKSPAAEDLHTQIQYRLIEALSAAEKRYEHLMNTLTEVVFVFDQNGCLRILNNAWKDHTGFDIEDCLGQTFQSFMADLEFARFQTLMAGGDFRDEFQFSDCHGQPLWFEMSVKMRDNDYYGTMVCIHERKQSALALEHTEQQFRTVVESLSEILFQVDQHLLIRFLNPAWQEITGFDVSASVGCCILDFLHEADDFQENWFDHGVDPSQQELRLRCQNGSLRWMSVKVKSILNADGERLMTGAMLDIHDRKLMEASLRNSEQRYALLVSTTTDGIWDWDLNSDEVYFSPRWKEMLGYSEKELENNFSTWYTRVHPDDIRLAMNQVMACMEGRQPVYENIHRMKHRDGSWIWIMDRGIVLRDDKGLPYRMVGSHADVTNLKTTEAILQRREQELETVINISPDGIVTVSSQGLIQSVNPAFLQMTGFNLDTLLGMSEEALNTVLTQITCTQPLSKKHTNTGNQIYYIDLSKLRSHPLLADASKLQDKQDCKLRVLSRTERRLEQSDLAKVMYFRDISIESEVDQMKSRFISIAAHELRTPMASVFGFSELLLSREFDADTRREILQTIHQQSDSLVNMLNQLLDLARIDSRKELDFHLLRQPLWPIIQRACQELLILGDERNVKISVPKNEYWVDADAEKLRQVVRNVLVNAYKYSPQGGEISLRLKSNPEKTEIGIVIRDSGMGMDKEQIKHIYERFWRADHNCEIAGTGLGMSLVKEIMDIHQGRITIKSKLGEGTTVTLWLMQVQPSPIDNEGIAHG